MDQGDDGDGQTANADYSIRIAAGIGAFTRMSGTALPEPRAATQKTAITRSFHSLF